MRLVRTLSIIVAASAAALAFGASSAAGQVEVTDEATGGHCTAVTLDANHNVSGGCRIEAISEPAQPTQVQAFNGMTFVTVFTCGEHFEAAIGEDGTGYIYHAVHTSHGGDPCMRTQCDEADHALIPWPLALESASNMEFTFCLRNVTSGEGDPGTPCHTNIDITDDGVHNYEFHANGTTSGSCENLGGGVRIIAHWNIVPTQEHPAIEIN
jgi:hypothetical protein